MSDFACEFKVQPNFECSFKGDEEIANLLQALVFFITATLGILANCVYLGFFLKFKESKWKISDFDTVVLIFYHIICCGASYLTAIWFCSDFGSLVNSLGCQFKYCFVYMTVLEITRINFMKITERFISVKFRAHVKKAKLKYSNSIIGLKLSSRILSSLIVVFYSMSPLFVTSWRSLSKCKQSMPIQPMYILTTNLIIFLLVILTLLVYLLLCMHLVREKNRKVSIYERCKSINQELVSNINEKLKRKMFRLSMVKTQTVFFICFSIIATIYLFISTAQVLSYDSCRADDAVGSLNTAKNFFFGISLLILTIEPVMYFLSIRNIKKLF